jgi:hypothetical protein
VTVATRMVEPVDPTTDPGWESERTWVQHEVNTSGVQFAEPDFHLHLNYEPFHQEPRYRFDVYEHMAVGDLPECWGAAGFDGTWYSATVPADCLGAPAQVGVAVYAAYDEPDGAWYQDRHPGQDTAYFEPFVAQ